jgi:hypothetical protein
MKDGIYVFRFSGFAMTAAAGQGSQYLIGIGTMQIKGGTISRGEQAASITRLYGQAAHPTNHRYAIRGEIDPADTSGVSEATILFDIEDVITDPTDNSGKHVKATFDFVAVGQDRFWVISKKTMNLDTNPPTEADEVVTGEAIWTADLPAAQALKGVKH